MMDTGLPLRDTAHLSWAFLRADDAPAEEVVRFDASRKGTFSVLSVLLSLPLCPPDLSVEPRNGLDL